MVMPSWSVTGVFIIKIQTSFQIYSLDLADDLIEQMMVMADQEELNHLFSDSLTDEDLLRAVEQIESNQMSTERTVKRSVINDETVESTSNLGASTGSHNLDGKFIISFRIYR